MRGSMDLAENRLAVGVGMFAWTAHFMVGWAISVIFPGEPIVRWLVVLLSLLCWGAVGWAVFYLLRHVGRADISPVAWLALAGSALAVFYNTLPALIG